VRSGGIAVVLFSALLAGCGYGSAAAEVALFPSQPVALNAAIDVALDGYMDPLSVTAASIRVTRWDGSEAPAEMTVCGAHVLIHLVITDAFLDEAPSAVWIELVGLPSSSALTTLDGRHLRSTVRRCVRLLPALRPSTAEPPRLIAINGGARDGDPVQLDGAVVLSFSDVLDPGTVSSSTCPVFPVAGDITLLTPLLPEVRWECVGGRFDVILAIPAGSGHLQFILRKSGLRDLVGRPPEPAGATVELQSP